MRGCFGLFFYLLFVFPLLLAIMLALSVFTWVGDRDFYDEIVTSEALYEAIYAAELPEFFGDEVLQWGPRDATTQADEQSRVALALALREVVPREFLQSELTRVVDETFTLVDSDDWRGTVTVDLTPVQEDLRGDGGIAFSRTLVANLPACAPNERRVFGDTGLLSCLPQDLTEEEAQGIVLDTLPAVIDDIPDELTIVDFTGTNGTSLQQGLIAASIMMVIIGGAIWLLNGLIGGAGSRRSVLLWLGVTLFIPAMLVLSIGASINQNLFDDTIREGVQDVQFESIEGTEDFREALTDVITSTLDRVWRGFLLVGGTAAIIGFVLAVFGILTPSPREFVAVPQGAPY